MRVYIVLAALLVTVLMAGCHEPAHASDMNEESWDECMQEADDYFEDAQSAPTKEEHDKYRSKYEAQKEYCNDRY